MRDLILIFHCTLFSVLLPNNPILSTKLRISENTRPATVNFSASAQCIIDTNAKLVSASMWCSAETTTSHRKTPIGTKWVMRIHNSLNRELCSRSRGDTHKAMAVGCKPIRRMA